MSIAAGSFGPMARQVTVPGGTTVNAASRISTHTSREVMEMINAAPDFERKVSVENVGVTLRGGRTRQAHGGQDPWHRRREGEGPVEVLGHRGGALQSAPGVRRLMHALGARFTLLT